MEKKERKKEKKKGKKEGKETKGEAKVDTKGGKDDKKAAGNPLRDRIFGVHVQTYMDKLKKDSKERYNLQFSVWEKCVSAAKVKTLEELYKKVHAEIRKNPVRATKAKKNKVEHKRDAKDKNVRTINGKTYRRDVRLKLQERKQRVQDKIQKYLKERSRK